MGIQPSLPGVDKPRDEQENVSQNIKIKSTIEKPRLSTPYTAVDTISKPVKARPTTSYTQVRMDMSHSSDFNSAIDYGGFKLNDDLRALRADNKFFKKRNVMSAVPKGLPPTQYRRVSIKQATKKEMRHGKFSKFIDFLLELKSEAQNASLEEVLSVIPGSDSSKSRSVPGSKMGKRNMSLPAQRQKKATKKDSTDYYILTIANEVENYFKLDEVRKKRVRDSLAAQVKSNPPSKVKTPDVMKRSEVIEELERAIMQVSEELIYRKTQSSIANSKSKRIDVSKIQEEHLKNIGEEFFKASDKRKVLKLFCNSEPIKRIIAAFSKGDNSESLVFLKPGMKSELVNAQE